MVKVHDIILVDTPGFDDTQKTDTEILTMICRLANRNVSIQVIPSWKTLIHIIYYRYKRDIKLAGILYFHRISDNRVAGTPLKNIRMFQKLCGKKHLGEYHSHYDDVGQS